jgi:hypothetical protein
MGTTVTVNLDLVTSRHSSPMGLADFRSQGGQIEPPMAQPRLSGSVFASLVARDRGKGLSFSCRALVKTAGSFHNSAEQATPPRKQTPTDVPWKTPPPEPATAASAPAQRACGPREDGGFYCAHARAETQNAVDFINDMGKSSDCLHVLFATVDTL